MISVYRPEVDWRLCTTGLNDGTLSRKLSRDKLEITRAILLHTAVSHFTFTNKIFIRLFYRKIGEI